MTFYQTENVQAFLSQESETFIEIIDGIIGELISNEPRKTHYTDFFTFLKENSRITLFHAMRGGVDQTESPLYVPPECIDAAREAIHDYFDAAIDLLQNCGFDKGAIETRIEENISSRALAIRREAEEGDYGTIVVGRRGMSRVKDFFIGRVSSKVLNGAREHAVWVVT